MKRFHHVNALSVGVGKFTEFVIIYLVVLCYFTITAIPIFPIY